MIRGLWAVFFIMLSIILTGCGFRLQGFEPLPPKLQTLAVVSDTPYDPFIQKVKASLVQRHVIIIDDPTKAPFVLHVNNIHVDVTQISIATSQQTRQYQVTFLATFSVTGQKGEITLNPFTVGASQPQILHQYQLPTNTPEVNNLVLILQQQVITQMFDHLSTPLVIKALADYEKELKISSKQSNEN